MMELKELAKQHPKSKGARHSMGVVKVSIEQHVMLVVLNRPRFKNAFNDELYLAMIDVLEVAEEDENVRAVVITGAGDYFSSGQDLGSATDPTYKQGKGLCFDPVGVFMAKILSFSKLLVAIVNGPAIGIGTTLLMACDVIYATPSAYFMTPFALLGIVPECASSVLLRQRLGTTVANEVLLFAKKLSVGRAREVGLVAEILDKEVITQTVVGDLKTLVSKPVMEKTLPLFKSLQTNQVQKQLVKDAFYKELGALERRFAEGDAKRAIQAYWRKGTSNL